MCLSKKRMEWLSTRNKMDLIETNSNSTSHNIELYISDTNVNFINDVKSFISVEDNNNAGVLLESPPSQTIPVPTSVELPIKLPVSIPIEMNNSNQQNPMWCKSDIWNSYCLLGPNIYFLPVFRHTPNSSLIQPSKSLYSFTDNLFTNNNPYG